MDLMQEPLRVLSDLILPLTEFGIPYVIGGSFASGAHGEFRATQDIDIVVDLSTADLPSLASRLSENFFVNLDSIVAAVAAGRSCNIFHKQTAFKVDFFTKVDAFSKQQLERAITLRPFDSKLAVQIAAPEDTILAKLRWYKLGDCSSERQWRDLLGVLKLNRERLDLAYLQHWAKNLEVSDLLLKLLDEERRG